MLTTNHQPIFPYCMKPQKIKVPKLCFIFPNVHSVLCFPLENIAPETLLRTHYNKPVKVSLTLVHYRKILYIGVVLRQI